MFQTLSNSTHLDFTFPDCLNASVLDCNNVAATFRGAAYLFSSFQFLGRTSVLASFGCDLILADDLVSVF